MIEESPSPFLDEELREKLLTTALRGVKHIGYTNLGTMEFIFDEHKNFYFLEMNTRLQVEHPVTEEITGLDLVEWQLQIAAKQPLPLQQDQIHRNGHAIECRLYAEDPVTYFPSPGQIERLTLPVHQARFDFGVVEGNHVTPFYDPMIGKIIVHGRNRRDSLEKTKHVLEQIEIQGIKTNLPLLKKIMQNDLFAKGHYTTKFLDHFNLNQQVK